MQIAVWIVVGITSVIIALALVDYPVFLRFFGPCAKWRFMWLELPASKLSMIHCMMLVLTPGLIAGLGESFPLFSRLLFDLFFVQIALTILFLVRDYKINKANKDKAPKSTDS